MQFVDQDAVVIYNLCLITPSIILLMYLITPAIILLRPCIFLKVFVRARETRVHYARNLVQKHIRYRVFARIVVL